MALIACVNTTALCLASAFARPADCIVVYRCTCVSIGVTLHVGLPLDPRVGHGKDLVHCSIGVSTGRASGGVLVLGLFRILADNAERVYTLWVRDVHQ